MNIFLTGATGFLGGSLTNYLRRQADVTLTVAHRSKLDPPDNAFFIQDLSAETDWSSALVGQQVIIHAAARAHVMKDEVADPQLEYQRVNVEGTVRLARQAAEAGVKRFIFVSSIGVNGNVSTRPFSAEDEPRPAEPYARSKWEAERELLKIHEETGMELVIIRPPLVYGPNAPGNFGSLVRWIEKGIPLPLGAIDNKRSLVGIDNLVNLIVCCIDHPAAANQTFLAGDGEDISTTELLRGVGAAMRKPARLIPVPAGLLYFGAILLGKRAMAQRLLGSLQVDISKTRKLLGWQPPYTVAEGLRRCFEPTNR